MNNRLVPALIIVFILLAGMIIFIDILSESPEKKLILPDVKEVSMQENNQGMSDIDAYFNTKETIKKRGKIEEKVASDSTLSTKQNPFLFPEEILLLKIGKENLSDKELAEINNKIAGEKELNEEEISSRFHLSMIMMGQAQKIALVNQQFVVEGDGIDDFIVEKISRNSITLVNKEETKEILLEPDFVPLIHKSSDSRIGLTEETETTQEGEHDKEAGNLKKQLQDVLKMYDQMDGRINDQENDQKKNQ